jgi:hypothetical protein
MVKNDRMSGDGARYVMMPRAPIFRINTWQPARLYNSRASGRTTES